MLTGNIKEILLTTAEEVLGKRCKKFQLWIKNVVLDLCDKRQELRGKKHSGKEAWAWYQDVNRQVRKKIWIDKEEWIEEQCSTIEKGMETGDSKNAYSTLKSLTKTSQLRTAVTNDQDGKLITDNEKVLKRWTKYCKGLYNYEIHPYTSLLQTDLPSMDGEDSLLILKEEVEAAVQSLNLGKSPGVDNIPSELVKNGGKEVVKALTALCQWIWEQKKWPKEWTQSLMIPLPKKGNLRQCKNHRMISLISHPSKVILHIILNHLKSKAEEILSEEQAGFTAGWSTVEQIFNCRVLIEKHLPHQRDLFHNFINFKKAFKWVWHNGLWHVLRGFNIENGSYKSSRPSMTMPPVQFS